MNHSLNRVALSALLASVCLFSATGYAKAPSSEIPEKREFPLSTTTNPCEDFHKYVCSEAEASFKLRPDRSHHLFAFSDSRERLLEIKKKFMAELPQKKGLSERSEQMRDMYMSCMDPKARANSEKAEVKKFQKDLKDIETTEELVTYVNTHASKGLFGPFVWMGNTPDLDNPKKLNIIIGGSLMNLPDHKYYEDAKLMADYKKLLTSFFKAIDPKVKAADAEKRATDLVELEKDFIKVFPVAAVRRQRWSERFLSTQEDTIKKYPNLKFEILFKKTPKDALVSQPIAETATFLNEELPKRPLAVWKDYLLVKNLSDQMDDAYPKFFQQNFDFEKKYFGGPDTRSVRAERCTDMVTEYFMKELDAALVDQVFPNFDEKKVQDVAESIRASILEGLKNNKWLSSEGKKGAIAKIKVARLQLVKPHSDKEWDFMPIRKYTKTDLMVNKHLYREAAHSKMMKELQEPANQDAWGMGPLTVNAYYSENENKFVLPIGILQYPFYNKDGSLIENLGAVGAVVGHELGHSIDDNGAKYDSEGRLKQWMTQKDVFDFAARQKKLVDQFNKAEHDGRLTLGENTADLVGMTFAYNAAFPEGKGSVDDKKKFFVAYGRLWCSVTRPDFEKLMRKTDPHASGAARINEQVKQQPAFAEVFQCKAGDKMTLPENERVQIW
ncbi:M13 family metallopeptidase [Bdellovibrio svalbardensis]|uniref:M13 family metallopeptidase n=1 Tax=Bdellovibrio svalbardensis TaxID=2972972 RepID=A0ABT6DH44_9BACT|nr:M13 family metallopeptidase [Bdellovibrio svalbardensis]MDG0815239.1 M13 family metallopeptidase [Bdellovibrio svalbardensis]